MRSENYFLTADCKQMFCNLIPLSTILQKPSALLDIYDHNTTNINIAFTFLIINLLIRKVNLNVMHDRIPC
jgi:hypothetical protein